MAKPLNRIYIFDFVAELCDICTTHELSLSRSYGKEMGKNEI